jgi:hypothetical protein
MVVEGPVCHSSRRNEIGPPVNLRFPIRTKLRHENILNLRDDYRVAHVSFSCYRATSLACTSPSPGTRRPLNHRRFAAVLLTRAVRETHRARAARGQGAKAGAATHAERWPVGEVAHSKQHSEDNSFGASPVGIRFSSPAATNSGRGGTNTAPETLSGIHTTPQVSARPTPIPPFASTTGQPRRKRIAFLVAVSLAKNVHELDACSGHAPDSSPGRRREESPRLSRRKPEKHSVPATDTIVYRCLSLDALAKGQ